MSTNWMPHEIDGVRLAKCRNCGGNASADRLIDGDPCLTSPCQPRPTAHVENPHAALPTFDALVRSVFG